MMELKNNQQSVLQGNEVCISRILAREASKGQSSRIFYRSAEGVPFKWEMNPGTPKNPQEEDPILPLSPSPLMRSLGLPLPNVDGHDEHKESTLKTSIILSLRKIRKKSIISDISKKVEILGNWRSKQQESSRFGDSNNGDFVASVKGSSFSSSSPFSSSFSSNGRVVDTSTIDGPFCCNPLAVHAILDESNTKIYYCNHHKTAFAVEENNSFLSRILSRVSTNNNSDQFSGPLDHNQQTHAQIPFNWETQPGTPKNPPENELIPPPSPPPAVQSLALPRPRQQGSGGEAHDSAWKKKALFWRRKNKENDRNVENVGISFRYWDDNVVDGSFRRSSSVSSVSSVASKPRGPWGLMKMRRGFHGGYLGCSPWFRKDVFVFAKRKFKSFTS